MTLEELRQHFRDGFTSVVGYKNHDAELEGVRRVVEALRDEMSGASRLRDIEKLFDEILTSGEVKAADGHASEYAAEVLERGE